MNNLTEEKNNRSRPKAEEDICSKRIESIRISKGLSRSQLAEKLGITLGGVSAWEYGRTRPDLNSIRKLCAIFGVSSDEILGIESTAFKLSNEEIKLIEQYRKLPENEKGYVTGLIGVMKAKPAEPVISIQPKTRIKRNERILTLPVNPLSMCAGNGLELGDPDECEYMRLKATGVTLKCDEIVRISGRSMEPEFYDGDFALVQHTDSLSEGEIGVFVIDGEGMIKQYRKDGLYPFNKQFDVIRPSEYSNVSCFGRVLGKVTDEALA